MAKKKIGIGDPVQIADKLYKIQAEMLAFTEPLKDLKDKEAAIRVELLESLRANRLQQLKDERGITYTSASRMTYKITDEDKAMPWLVKNDLLRPDTVKMGKVLAKTPGALPEGIWVEETPYLSVTGIKEALS